MDNIEQLYKTSAKQRDASKKYRQNNKDKLNTYHRQSHKNKLNEKYVNRLEKFLDMLNDDDTKFTDQDNQRIYTSYKAYKINSIKFYFYTKI